MVTALHDNANGCPLCAGQRQHLLCSQHGYDSNSQLYNTQRCGTGATTHGGFLWQSQDTDGTTAGRTCLHAPELQVVPPDLEAARQCLQRPLIYEHANLEVHAATGGSGMQDSIQLRGRQ